MKKYSKKKQLIIATMACFFASYLLVAFVQAELDPYAWQGMHRVFMATIAFFLSMFAWMYVDTKND